MMTIPLYCGECIKESNEAGKVWEEEFQGLAVEINDASVYHVKCPKGHSTKIILFNEKFEVLFELGLNGLVDGYYREAVTSFTSALERFFEFFIKVITSNKTNSTLYLQAWRQVKSQSERQLGAFIFIYLNTIGEMPLLTSEEDTAFRNRTIHKGYIPTLEEAQKYGENIRLIVNTTILKMREMLGGKLVEIYDKTFRDYDVPGEKFNGCNILTVLDVKNGPDFPRGDSRNKPIAEMGPDIIKNRGPYTMRMFKDKAERKVYREKLNFNSNPENYAKLKLSIAKGLLDKNQEAIFADSLLLFGMDPTNPTVMNDLLTIFKDDFDQFRAIVEELGSKYHQNPEATGNIHYHFGILLNSMSQKGEAAEYLRKAKNNFERVFDEKHKNYYVIEQIDFLLRDD